MPDVWADRTEKRVLDGAVYLCLGILIVLFATGNLSEGIIEAMILFILLLSGAMIVRRGFIENVD